MNAEERQFWLRFWLETFGGILAIAQVFLLYPVIGNWIIVVGWVIYLSFIYLGETLFPDDS